MRENQFTPWLNFAVSAASAYFLTPVLWPRFGFQVDPFTYFVTFIGIGIFMVLFVNPLSRLWLWSKNRNKYKNYSENVSLRRLKGLFTDLFIFTVLFGAAYFYGHHIKLGGTLETIPDISRYAAFALAFVLSLLIMRFGKKWFGFIIKPFRFRRHRFGHGGSAGFAKMFDEWPLKYRRGAILLGSSLYSPARKRAMYKLGYKDDRHLITIAANRAGKGRSTIIPNLIEWPNSALVIDPKGTNAAVTALRRGKGGGRISKSLGQNVHVVDPFGIVEGIETSCFNPLSEIYLSSATIMEDISLIAEAIVVTEGGKYAEHFMEAAQSIIAGIIAHLLSKSSHAFLGDGKNTLIASNSPQPSLVDVRNALTQPAESQERFFCEMAENSAAGGLPKTATSLLENAGPNERGAFFTTVTRNTKWIDSLPMKKVLARSDFTLKDLKKGNTTIYIVLPPHMLEEHKRFMRLFVNLSIREMSVGKRSKKPVLFVLDEFFSLGPLKQLEKAAGLLGSYNAKLWPILQNISQLKELYPQNWETFMSNAGAIQFFAVNDLET
ncbi:MAG: type IV secretory system conjugative DNA transfer family protein, partial [Deltaproteobacteria bacterium]|nr:type IV secretory system conjugative DNA transfer family protein [Deltaproteobacteria bacterium]